jgi:acyl-CoA hydrolase
MAWVDIVGGIVGFRHSEGHCTTASIDYLSFDKPIRVNDVIVLDGYITYVGRTSMEIRVNTFVEKPGGELEPANSAYLVYVAIDGNGIPRPVPRLSAETEEERAELAEGAKRALIRRERRQKTLNPNSLGDSA